MKILLKAFCKSHVCYIDKDAVFFLIWKQAVRLFLSSGCSQWLTTISKTGQILILIKLPPIDLIFYNYVNYFEIAHQKKKSAILIKDLLVLKWLV